MDGPYLSLSVKTHGLPFKGLFILTSIIRKKKSSHHGNGRLVTFNPLIAN